MKLWLVLNIIKCCTGKVYEVKQTYMYDHKKINNNDVSFSCVCLVIDYEFHNNIVKLAVDPRGDNPVDPQTTLAML